jgi:hypothetical protein
MWFSPFEFERGNVIPNEVRNPLPVADGVRSFGSRFALSQDDTNTIYCAAARAIEIATT